LAFVYVWLLLATVRMSLATVDPQTHYIRFSPPSGEAFAAFFSGPGPELLARSLGYAVQAVALAAVPAVLTGYFLALKAPRVLRSAGVFVLLLAWALTPVRTMAMFHFIPSSATDATSPLLAWLPWLVVQPGSSTVLLFALGAIPPLALVMYSAYRGQFLGLPWPESGRTRLDRFVGEAIPRSIAGFAIGSILAGATVLFDLVTTSMWASPEGRAFVDYVMAFARNPQGPPIAAVGVLFIVVIIAATFVVAAAVVWLAHLLSRALVGRMRAIRLPVRDRALSVASFVVTGIATVFVLVSLVAPLVVAAAYSVQEDFGRWGSFTAKWYLGEAWGTPSEIRGAWTEPEYARFLQEAVGAALVASMLGVLLAVLLVAGLRSLRTPYRGLASAAVFTGIVVPLGLLSVMDLFASSALVLPGMPWTGWILERVPLAMGVAVATIAPSLLWRPARTPGRWTDWFLPALAGFLLSFAVTSNAFAWPDGSSSLSDLAYGFLARKWATPEVDAFLTTATLIALGAMLPAWVLLWRREGFRF